MYTSEALRLNIYNYFKPLSLSVDIPFVIVHAALCYYCCWYMKLR